MTDIGAGIAVSGIESGFKRKDTQHFIAQPGDGMDPSTFPRPYFRRDIIDDLGVR